MIYMLLKRVSGTYKKKKKGFRVWMSGAGEESCNTRTYLGAFWSLHNIYIIYCIIT